MVPSPASRGPSSRGGRRPRAGAGGATLLAALALALSGAALAHATLVFGEVTLQPAAPRAGERLTLNLTLHDPLTTPVEDALVFLEAAPHPGPGREGEEALFLPEPLVSTERFVEVAPGVYRTEFALPHEGEWRLVFRDQTYRQEEARAGVDLRLGADATRAPLRFVFPPTATGPDSLATWLVFVVGIPLLAGVGVTVAALRKGGDAPDAPTEQGPAEPA